MAIQLNIGKVTRRDYLLVDPDEIIVDEEANGRAAPHTAEAIQKRVESILAYGQITPINGRKIADGKVTVAHGFLRLAAIRHINANKLTPEPMQVKIIVSGDQNDEDAFLANLVENMHREDLTALDHAHNQRVLRDRYGWDDEKVAKFYGMSPRYVELLSRSLCLPAEVKAEVKSGNMSFSAARDLIDIPEATAKKIVRESKGKDGKVDPASVTKAVHEVKIANGRARARTAKETREFFESFTGLDTPEPIVEFCKGLVEFLAGSIPDKSMEDLLYSSINKAKKTK